MALNSLVVCVSGSPPAQLYLIAFTGYADADIRDSCLDAGFDMHLVKPGDINLLEKLLGSDRTGA